MSLVGALNKIGAAYKKSAPFHSAVDEALASLARQKGTGPEFLRELSKTPGVKPAELSHRKLDKILQSHGKITKEDVLKLARENPPPKLYESVGQDLTDKQLAQKADEIAHSWGYRDYDDLLPEFQRQVDDQLEKMQTQYGDYKLPGGENYREIKMRLPHFTEEDSHKLMKLEADQRRTDPVIWNTLGDAYRLKELQAKKAALGDQYLSSHWQGEPNVLAHMRVSDRTGPEGQKVLHVEEIQSDWHQAGRSKGYKEEPKKSWLVKKPGDKVHGSYDSKEEATNAMQSLARAYGEEPRHLGLSIEEGVAPDYSGAVPDAPFKKNWHELAMKRLLNYAADNGYDSIAITPGAEQAKRYDLSKQLSEVEFDPVTGHLAGRDPQGKLVVAQRGVTKENLPDYIGKEGAQKILEAKPNDFGVHALSGTDLQVGGEGMKGFYDQMLPAYLNQFGKKYGTQVGSYEMPNPRTGLSINDVQKEAGINEQQWLDLPSDEKMRLIDEMDAKAKAATTPLHHFPITPEMREEIATKGIPLYRKGGTVNIEQEYKLKKLRK